MAILADLKGRFSTKQIVLGSCTLLFLLSLAIFGTSFVFPAVLLFLIICSIPLITKVVMKLFLYTFSLAVVVVGIFVFLGLAIWIIEKVL